MALDQDYHQLWFINFRLTNSSGHKDPIQLHLRPKQILPAEILDACEDRDVNPFELLTECSKKLFYDYPLGTQFRLKAKLTDLKGAGLFFYTSYQWAPIEIVKPKKVSAAKKTSAETTKRKSPVKRAAKKSTGTKKTSPTKATRRKTVKKKAAAKKSAAKKTSRKTAKKAPKITEKAIRKTGAFREASSKAEDYAKDPEKLRSLFEEATEKARKVPRGAFAETWAYFLAMLRLLRAYYKDEYRDVPWQSLLLIIIAVIYFVAPIDLIPDVIPVVGYLDDAFVIGLALRAVRSDLDAFMEWETQHE